MAAIWFENCVCSRSWFENWDVVGPRNFNRWRHRIQGIIPRNVYLIKINLFIYQKSPLWESVLVSYSCTLYDMITFYGDSTTPPTAISKYRGFVTPPTFQPLGLTLMHIIIQLLTESTCYDTRCILYIICIRNFERQVHKMDIYSKNA